MPKESTAKNGIYRRGNTWYVSIRINGQRIRRAAGTTRQSAELVLAELKKQRAITKLTNEMPGIEQLTKRKTINFAEAAEAYLSERTFLKPSTRRGYAEILKNYLLPEFGQLKLTDLTEDRVARFQAKVATRVSAVRTNNIMNLLRYILKVCVRRKFIRENPASFVAPLPEPQPDIDPLTLDELKRALKHLHPHYRPLFTCLAFTGARPNELLALRWEHVDLDRREIHIRVGRVRGNEDVPKTAASMRVIPMLSVVHDVLVTLKQTQAVTSDGYVFVTKKGLPINKHVDRQWREALKKARLKHRPAYQLRHTFASYCLQQGCDPGWVAKVLGHSSLEITFRYYARFINNAGKLNEKLLDNALLRRDL